MRVACSATLCVWAIWTAGCGVEHIDYETALNLVRDRTMDPVKITISASPHFSESDPKIKQYYDQLVEGHVLTCEANGTVGMLCQPGPVAEGVSQEGSMDLSVNAGRWIPAVITKINRAGRGAVTAELRLTFEPSPLYREYREALDALQNSSSSRLSLAEQKEGKTAHASFVHAEDGWHVENMHLNM
jgi:hypothetical protein